MYYRESAYWIDDADHFFLITGTRGGTVKEDGLAGVVDTQRIRRNLDRIVSQPFSHVKR
jgi:hypothetical protein